MIRATLHGFFLCQTNVRTIPSHCPSEKAVSDFHVQREKAVRSHDMYLALLHWAKVGHQRNVPLVLVSFRYALSRTHFAVPIQVCVLLHWKQKNLQKTRVLHILGKPL